MAIIGQYRAGDMGDTGHWIFKDYLYLHKNYNEK